LWFVVGHIANDPGRHAARQPVVAVLLRSDTRPASSLDSVVAAVPWRATPPGGGVCLRLCARNAGASSPRPVAAAVRCAPGRRVGRALIRPAGPRCARQGPGKVRWVDPLQNQGNGGAGWHLVGRGRK